MCSWVVLGSGWVHILVPRLSSSPLSPSTPIVGLLSPIPYVGGRKVRRVFAGGYLGRTERSKLAVLCGYLNVSWQRMRWYHLTTGAVVGRRWSHHRPVGVGIAGGRL